MRLIKLALLDTLDRVPRLDTLNRVLAGLDIPGLDIPGLDILNRVLPRCAEPSASSKGFEAYVLFEPKRLLVGADTAMTCCLTLPPSLKRY